MLSSQVAVFSRKLALQGVRKLKWCIYSMRPTYLSNLYAALPSVTDAPLARTSIGAQTRGKGGPPDTQERRHNVHLSLRYTGMLASTARNILITRNMLPK